jgi:hypothetical protein
MGCGQAVDTCGQLWTGLGHPTDSCGQRRTARTHASPCCAGLRTHGRATDTLESSKPPAFCVCVCVRCVSLCGQFHPWPSASLLTQLQIFVMSLDTIIGLVTEREASLSVCSLCVSARACGQFHPWPSVVLLAQSQILTKSLDTIIGLVTEEEQGDTRGH